MLTDTERGKKNTCGRLVRTLSLSIPQTGYEQKIKQKSISIAIKKGKKSTWRGHLRRSARSTLSEKVLDNEGEKRDREEEHARA